MPQTQRTIRISFTATVLSLCLIASTSNAEDVELTVEQLVEQVKPSVVVVTFAGRDGQQQGLGSGFVLDGNGLIATNLHVIGEARPIKVRTFDGKQFPVVEVHATDRVHDLAILKINAEDLSPLELGDSDTLKQGQSIVAFGNPLGLEHSVVQGVVSGLREDVDGKPMIQLAIPIERGNSGGPMVDMQGRVHGLLTLKSQVTRNLGYAAPVNDLKLMLEHPNPVPISRWLTIGTLNGRLWEVRDDVQWRQRAGRILVDGPGRGFGGRTFVFSKLEIPEKPYEVAVTVRMNEADGAAGLIFHADGGDRHYGFYPSSGKLRFTRFDGPDVYSWKVLDEKEVNAFRKDDWNRLKVRIDEGLIKCFCNEQLVFESADDQFTNGRAGLAKFRHTTAQFKQFAVGEQVSGEVLSQESRDHLQQLVQDIPVDVVPPKEMVDEVLSLGTTESAGSLLQERARELEQQAARLRELAQAVQTESVVRRLSTLFRPNGEEPPADVDLVHAALLLAAIDNSELDIDGYREQVDEMADELRSLVPADPSEAEKMETLHEYLFSEMGYHGSRTNYHHASNSYLNEVIDDREGLPITLSLLYMELADRIDLKVDGVGLPGHFIVGVHLGEKSTQLVDVFDRGTLMSLNDAKERVLSYTGRPWDNEYLAPCTDRQIIVRMLRNLLSVANSDEDPESALRYVNALLAVEPDSAQDRLFRAVLCYNTNRAEQGLDDVNWVLEQAPAGIDLRRVEQLQGLLQRQVAD
ncbi:MAG: tetratricopeptide repeat protein [Planctomycetaceae bacterium]|nr:tetratricopeptide repeat protein [Planctomycetaceae bacterium]